MTEKKKGFFATHLDPGGIFGEILFGLIMVLTFTLGAGLTAEDGPAGVRTLLIAAIGLQHRLGHHRRRHVHHGRIARPGPAQPHAARLEEA